MSGTWPDGLPVHDLVLYVRLGCGHERVSRGWRGQEGETYCCDACNTLTTMEVIALTDDMPYPWRLADGESKVMSDEAIIRVELTREEIEDALGAFEAVEGEWGPSMSTNVGAKLRTALDGADLPAGGGSQ